MTKEEGHIVISGGTGLIGQALQAFLRQQGKVVKCLTTNKKLATEDQSDNYFYWNPDTGEIDATVFDQSTAIIHLAGSSINQAWNKKNKQNIIQSRVKSTQLLYKTLQEIDHHIKTIISSSAVGWYPDKGDSWLREDHPAGDGFLSEIVVLWESETKKFETLGVRNIQLRTGVVLSREGGALKTMEIPVKWGIGSPLGSGKQYMPWIHIEDMCEMIHFLLEKTDCEGVFNAVAPHPETNNDFTRTLAKVLSKPYFFPAVPAWLLKIVLGERAEIVLRGCRASAKKIKSKGFAFKYDLLSKALLSLYKQ